jgi:3-deoxy-D-manno-octulosonic-acid transferase
MPADAPTRPPPSPSALPPEPPRQPPPPAAAAAGTVFPPRRLHRLLLAVYGALWVLALPLAWLYLRRRGRREPLYHRHFNERLGAVRTALERPVVFHAASLGELRGAAPLVRALLAQGWPVLVSTLTPAGRNAAGSLFAEALAQGRLEVVYTPVEAGFAVRRLLARVRPRCVLVTEIDTWPTFVSTVRRAGVPLAMVNAQYPRHSAERDLVRLWGFRAAMFQAYDLVLCKSETHAQRFRAAGCARVEIAGETRFDLPISQAQLDAAPRLLAQIHRHGRRPVVCIASSMAGEDEHFIAAHLRLQEHLRAPGGPPPLFVHVPRSPQRFDLVHDMLCQAGLRTLRRSRCLDAQLAWTGPQAIDEADVLLGDSLGEMYFFLALSDAVAVGSSFVPLGAHNIIEPLNLGKPVVVGPSIWGIEYPAVEALAIGMLHQVPDADALADKFFELLTVPEVRATVERGARQFLAEHAGATARHMAVLRQWVPG